MLCIFYHFLKKATSIFKKKRTLKLISWREDKLKWSQSTTKRHKKHVTKYGSLAVPGLVGSSEGTRLKPRARGKATKKDLHWIWKSGEGLGRWGAGGGWAFLASGFHAQEGSKETGYTEGEKGAMTRPDQEIVSPHLPPARLYAVQVTISFSQQPSEVGIGITPTLEWGNWGTERLNDCPQSHNR